MNIDIGYYYLQVHKHMLRDYNNIILHTYIHIYHLNRFWILLFTRFQHTFEHRKMCIFFINRNREKSKVTIEKSLSVTQKHSHTLRSTFNVINRRGKRC